MVTRELLTLEVVVHLDEMAHLQRLANEAHDADILINHQW